MRKYNSLIIKIIGIYILFIILLNVAMEAVDSSVDVSAEGREYRVWINRVKKDIESYEKENNSYPKNIFELMDYYGISEYPYIKEIYCIKLDELLDNNEFLNSENSDYVTYQTEKYLYKILYKIESKENGVIWINVVSVVTMIFLIIVLLYIRQSIIKPFSKFQNMPYELSKGNLSIPLKENKKKYFGKFLWGMDLLRENIEDNKKRELELQKEKKLLLLSLSHDIKTPLSAIKLYSKALSKNLYKDEAKKVEIIENIGVKVDEIEGFISEIVKASNDDFLVFEINNDEFYIKDMLKEVEEYYSEKMALNNIDFRITSDSNCIVKGDKDRAVEVVQNIIENAIKYGDGKKIHIIASKQEDGYQISVKNTGCMLDKRELPHVFDSFYRGSNVEKENGSGLGLYICKKLMNLMEGEISARIEEDSIMQINLLFRTFNY